MEHISSAWRASYVVGKSGWIDSSKGIVGVMTQWDHVAMLCAWQVSLELAQVFLVLTLSLCIYSNWLACKYCRRLRNTNGIKFQRTKKTSCVQVFRDGVYVPSYFLLLTGCTAFIFLNWQEPMTAVDNSLRHIYACVISTFLSTKSRHLSFSPTYDGSAHRCLLYSLKSSQFVYFPV